MFSFQTGLNYSYVEILMVGDEFTKNLSIENDPRVKQTFSAEEEADFSNINSLIEKNVNRNTKVVYIDLIRYEFIWMDIFRDMDEGPKVIKMLLNVDLNSLMQTVHYRSTDLASKFPKTRFIWCLPYPIDFLAFNLKSLNSHGCNDYDSDDIRAWSSLSKAFFLKIKEIKKIWDANYKTIEYINLNELFFKDATEKDFIHGINIFEKSFENNEGNFNWPKNGTNDGINLTSYKRSIFKSSFLNNLAKELKGLQSQNSQGKVRNM